MRQFTSFESYVYYALDVVALYELIEEADTGIGNIRKDAKIIRRSMDDR